MEPRQIAFFGATNSGKSTLMNSLAGQEVSLVSAVPGTTTDPVRKRIELPGIGACVLVDTAGYGDAGALGAERERMTRAVIDSTDVAVLILSGHPDDDRWEAMLHQAGVPVVRWPVGAGHDAAVRHSRPDRESLLQLIAAALPAEDHSWLTGNLVKPGDTVILVMPQDSEAPKGRIILPQVQVIRELLDRGCIPVCCTPERLKEAIAGLAASPALVITDSQVFGKVNAAIPSSWPLTSFSILLAAAKGDLKVFTEGASAISSLKPGSRILIAEACTHVPDTEDIGRVKIPALLHRRLEMAGQAGHDASNQTGHDASVTPGLTEKLQITIAAGNDFPEDLSGYDLIIHCGACVATSTLVRSRIRKARLANVPITNYGFALAFLQGILDRISLPNTNSGPRTGVSGPEQV